MEYLAQFLAEAVAAAAEPASPEGGVWTESDHSRLIHFAVTGTEAGQYSRDGVLSFRWRDGAALRPVPGRKGAVPPGLENALRLFLRAPADALAEAALRGRREGCVPAAPVLALIFLSFRDDALFRETFPRVVLDGADLRISTPTVRPNLRPAKTAAPKPRSATGFAATPRSARRSSTVPRWRMRSA